jgi:hypothetical protein
MKQIKKGIFFICGNNIWKFLSTKPFFTFRSRICFPRTNLTWHLKRSSFLPWCDGSNKIKAFGRSFFQGYFQRSDFLFWLLSFCQIEFRQKNLSGLRINAGKVNQLGYFSSTIQIWKSLCRKWQKQFAETNGLFPCQLIFASKKYFQNEPISSNTDII